VRGALRTRRAPAPGAGVGAGSSRSRKVSYPPNFSNRVARMLVLLLVLVTSATVRFSFLDAGFGPGRERLREDIGDGGARELGFERSRGAPIHAAERGLDAPTDRTGLAGRAGVKRKHRVLLDRAIPGEARDRTARTR